MTCTIRNLTPESIKIERIESFEDANTQITKKSSFLFGTKETTSPAPSAPKLGEHSQSFNHDDLDIILAPYDAYTYSIGKRTGQQEDETSHIPSASPPQKALRITISNLLTQERHRTDINPTATQKCSKSFTPLSPSPSTTYTALFHPTSPTPYLTIHTNHLQNPRTWLTDLPSTLPLSALSIPGTHNSHTYYRALPSVRCQVHGVQAQLENGIRFLDIRLQPVYPDDPNKKDLYLVHGAFPISLTGPKYFEQIVKTCYAFLDKHPGETILMSLKREGIGKSTDEQLSQILDTHYFSTQPQSWYTQSQIPYLSAARGKIVLLRRYTLCPSLLAQHNETGGIDGTNWPDLTPTFTHPPLSVQDFHSILAPTSIAEKLEHCTAHLREAASCVAFVPGVNTDARNPVPPGEVRLNFLSGSNFWNVGCWPEKIARIVNRGVEEWVVRDFGLVEGEDTSKEGDADDAEGQREGGIRRRIETGDCGTGIVIMDNVGEGGDWDLVRLIIGANMGVLGRLGLKA